MGGGRLMLGGLALGGLKLGGLALGEIGFGRNWRWEDWLWGIGFGRIGFGGLALGRLVDESVVGLAGEQCFSALFIYDFMRFPSINIVELSRCPTFAPAQCAGA